MLLQSRPRCHARHVDIGIGRMHLKAHLGGQLVKAHRKRRFRLLAPEGPLDVAVTTVNHHPVAGNIDRGKEWKAHDVVPVQMGHEHMVGLRYARAKVVEQGLAKVMGSAQYLDDLDFAPGLLHAVLDESTQAHAKLTKVDFSAAE